MTSLDRFFDHYYTRRPVNATFTGVHAYDDQLPDWSPAGLAALDAEMTSLGTELETEYPTPSSPSALRTSPDLLDAQLARGFLEIQRAENASLHGPRGNPSLWIGEAIFSIIALMIRDFAPARERIERAEARLARIAPFLTCSEEPASASDEPIGTLDPRTPVPRAWIEKAVRECEGAKILL